MNPYYPIYTEQPECQDCYKCVRECPVKAIHIKEGKASVIDERCVLCGECVKVCPVGAKKVRSDVQRAKRLLRTKKRVYISLAPSFVSEFSEASKEQLIDSLERLGFTGVSETALGAQEVSANLASELKRSEKEIFISSACPTVVNYIKKYHPELAERVSGLFSPVLAHCKLLKREFGEDVGIVFAGPCVSKKYESDQYQELLNTALTFNSLREWLDAEGIVPSQSGAVEGEKGFVPYSAQEGALYPVDGGMISGVKANCSVNDATFMSFSGLFNIKRVLKDIDSIPLKANMFLELLACEGGCVNGPAVSERESTALKRYSLIDYTSYPEDKIPRHPSIDIRNDYPVQAFEETEYTEDQLQKALESIGKYGKDEELNCGGCGYDSCRDFAAAVISDKAEPQMCVSYMRKLASKKANALLRSIPSGVVIVNEQLRIVECNKNFVSIMGEDASMVYEANPGMEGALIRKVTPFSEYFRKVLETGEDIINKNIRYNNTVLNVSLFSIETHRIVGAVIQDITAPAIKKEQIMSRAREVIDKNLSTIQQVAYLLGENASETETALESIIQSFSADRVEKGKK